MFIHHGSKNDSQIIAAPSILRPSEQFPLQSISIKTRLLCPGDRRTGRPRRARTDRQTEQTMLAEDYDPDNCSPCDLRWRFLADLDRQGNNKLTSQV